MGVSSHPHLWVTKSASLLGLIVTSTLAVNAGTIPRLSGRGLATLTGCEDSEEVFAFTATVVNNEDNRTGGTCSTIEKEGYDTQHFLCMNDPLVQKMCPLLCDLCDRTSAGNDALQPHNSSKQIRQTVDESIMSHTRYSSSDLDQTMLEEGVECLNVERLDTIYDFYALASDTPRSSFISLSENEEWLTNLLYDQNEILVRYKGSRIFKTVADTVEYFALGNGDFNGGNIDVYFTSIKEFIRCDDNNTVVVSTESRIFSTFDGDRADLSTDRFIFGSDSSLLVSVDTNVPTTVTIILQNTLFDREDFCENAVLKCPGELYPYENLQDCYDTLAHIPDRCDAGVKDDFTDGILQGDTMACRFLHLLSAGLRPIVHCPHLANISEVCVYEECLSATRLETPYELGVQFDARYSLWIRIVEMIVLGLVSMSILGSYLWFIGARRNFRDVLNSTDPLFDTLMQGDSKPIRPYIQFADARMSWTEVNEEGDDPTIFTCDLGYLGHCHMTCLTGESGSGKTSFIKTICGYKVGHVKLQIGQWLKRDAATLCPQDVSMWPQEMIVRDILLFACKMNDVDTQYYNDSFNTLGLDELMDQEFSTLSGGQQQRVSIAATIVRKEPTLIFLDEPLAPLDENNAIACLQTLKDLPLQHSFVLTVHNASPRIRDMFDRHIHLDGNFHHKMIEKRTPSLPPPVVPAKNDFNESANSYLQQPATWSTKSSVQASLILWYGQFFGKPLVEFLILICSIMGAIVVGFLARKSTSDWDDSFLPADEGARLPFYLADIFIGLVFISSFGCSLIFVNRERMLMNHFMMVRSLKPSAYLLIMMVVRSMAFAILQSVCWIFIGLPLLGFSSAYIDIILVNTILFVFAWTGATYGVGLLVSSSLYASHMIMIMDVFTTFFAGQFFLMSRLYDVFKILHYINPLFYILSASAFVLLDNMFETGCKDTQHPKECATSRKILEMSDLIPFTSLQAQGINIMFLIIFSFGAWNSLRPREMILLDPNKGADSTDAEADVFESSAARTLDVPDRRVSFHRSTSMSLMGRRKPLRSDSDWVQVSTKSLLKKSQRLSLDE